MEHLVQDFERRVKTMVEVADDHVIAAELFGVAYDRYMIAAELRRVACERSG